MDAIPAHTTTVELDTNLGAIVIELNHDKAPKTVDNFLQYVKSGHYNGKIFHRVIKGFMIQGGGYDENMREGNTLSPVENEADNGLANEIGTIAMARTSEPHSASAQFFINTANNQFLNYTSKTPQGWGYAVFGKVTKGMDIVEKIENATTGRYGMHADVPTTPIVINKATIIQ